MNWVTILINYKITHKQQTQHRNAFLYHIKSRLVQGPHLLRSCWLVISRVFILSIYFRVITSMSVQLPAGMLGRGRQGHTPPFKGKTWKRTHCYFHSHSIGHMLVTWQPLAAGETGKCSLYSQWPCLPTKNYFTL